MCSIEVQPRQVWWAESGALVCLAADTKYYVLRYDAAVLARARDDNLDVFEQGKEAFQVSAAPSAQPRREIHCSYYTALEVRWWTRSTRR